MFFVVIKLPAHLTLYRCFLIALNKGLISVFVNVDYSRYPISSFCQRLLPAAILATVQNNY